MKDIILYIWQLPQNLVGLIVLAWLSLRKRVFTHVRPDWAKGATLYYVDGFDGGLSLGRHIFLNSKYINRDGLMELHEYGHTRQSKMFGPLYLFVIGIPSAIWAVCWGAKKNNPQPYESFYTERWADELGCINRNGDE